LQLVCKNDILAVTDEKVSFVANSLSYTLDIIKKNTMTFFSMNKSMFKVVENIIYEIKCNIKVDEGV